MSAKQGFFSITLVLLLLVLALPVACSSTTPSPTAPATSVAPKPTAPATSVVPKPTAASPSPSAAPAKTYNLKFLNIYAVGSPYSVAEQEYFVNRVKELSSGRINIKLYSPGELGSPPEFPAMVRDGAADMAYAYMAYSSDIFPIFEVFSLPFLFKTYQQAVSTTRQFFTTAPELIAPLDKYNLTPLMYTDGASQIIQTKKPVNSLADLKGLKLRTAGGMANTVVESLGAVPVALMVGDAYSSIQSGVVDGTYTAGLFQEMYKWYEVAPNFLVPTSLIQTPLGVFIINQKLWKSMSKEDQDIINKAAVEQENIVIDRWTKDYLGVMDRMKTKGCTVRILTDAETQEFSKATQPAYDKFLKQNPTADVLLKKIQDWLAAHPAK